MVGEKDIFGYEFIDFIHDFALRKWSETVRAWSEDAAQLATAREIGPFSEKKIKNGADHFSQTTDQTTPKKSKKDVQTGRRPVKQPH